MGKKEDLSITIICVWIFPILGLLLLMGCLWRRRWLYYHAWKYQGPFAWPLIGNIYLFWEGYKGFYKKISQILASQPSIFRFWLGPDLIVVTSRPQDIEILLNTCLDKGKYYDLGANILREGLLSEPVQKWKVNRKMINPTFNSKILNSFVEIFVKYSKKLVVSLEEKCDGESFDMLPKIFRCTFDIAAETITDVDASSISGQNDFISKIMRMEEIMAIRIFSIWLHWDFLWKRSALGKEMDKLSDETFSFVKKITSIKKADLCQENDCKTNSNGSTAVFLDDDCKEKRFLNYLLKKNLLTDHVISEETQTMLVTASETTALTSCMVFLILTLCPDVQEKIRKELISIFDGGERDATLEDLNRMGYLECVIYETMRLLPTVPLIVRTAQHDVKLESHIVPGGSFVLIPIMHMNREPKVWKDPLKFDPDRFLIQDEANRHRCAYIPFSYGVRNCIGLKYGMMSMKIIISTLLRHYRFKPVQYKSLEDVELLYSIVSKPKGGFKIKLTKIIDAL